MSKLRLLAAALCLATLLAASTASAAVKSCGNLSATIGEIKAKNVTCKRARKVVRAHSGGTKMPFGFTCKTRAFEGGATTTCRKSGHKRVVYSIAD